MENSDNLIKKCNVMTVFENLEIGVSGFDKFIFVSNDDSDFLRTCMNNSNMNCYNIDGDKRIFKKGKSNRTNIIKILVPEGTNLLFDISYSDFLSECMDYFNGPFVINKDYLLNIYIAEVIGADEYTGKIYFYDNYLIE